MKILVTGAAGFIASCLVSKLLDNNHCVVGLDNMNDYYDINLKYDRLKLVGVYREQIIWNKLVQSSSYDDYRFVQMDLNDNESINKLFETEKFEIVCHLAAQAGVRYSIKNPYAYIKSNIEGFFNILEACKNNTIAHLVYASSSSVYGLNSKVPFVEKDSISHPVSLYAATKKSNELIAHSYSYLYDIPTTGLRFFTVYGPWGRPDMSPFLFMNSIFNDEPINIFNNGNMIRDFTYIDDIVNAIYLVLNKKPSSDLDWDPISPDPSSSLAPYRIYNVGASSPVSLIEFIETIEIIMGKKASKVYLPMQPGDVEQTYACVELLKNDFGFNPIVSLSEGVFRTYKWFIDYYGKK